MSSHQTSIHQNLNDWGTILARNQVGNSFWTMKIMPHRKKFSWKDKKKLINPVNIVFQWKKKLDQKLINSVNIVFQWKKKLDRRYVNKFLNSNLSSRLKILLAHWGVGEMFSGIKLKKISNLWFCGFSHFTPSWHETVKVVYDIWCARLK